MKRVTEAVGVCLTARDVFGASPLRDALERMTQHADAPDAKDGTSAASARLQRVDNGSPYLPQVAF